MIGYKCPPTSRADSSTSLTGRAPSLVPSKGKETSRETTPLPAFRGNNVKRVQDELHERSERPEDDYGDEEDREKRKNTVDMQQRRVQLEADIWATDVEPKQVRCRGCLRWIKLDQHSMYYRGLWDKHRDSCRGVKRLKGEPITKVKLLRYGLFPACNLTRDVQRTRRTKAALVLARNDKGETPIRRPNMSPSTSGDIEPRIKTEAVQKTVHGGMLTGDQEIPPRAASSSAPTPGDDVRSTRRRRKSAIGSTEKQTCSIPITLSDSAPRPATPPNAVATAPLVMNRRYPGKQHPAIFDMFANNLGASMTQTALARLDIEEDSSRGSRTPHWDKRRRMTIGRGPMRDRDVQTQPTSTGDGRRYARPPKIAKDERRSAGEVVGWRGFVHVDDGKTYSTEHYDDEDQERGVFAPDRPSECTSALCRHHFRFANQHELDTYFDGATIESMALRFSSSRSSFLGDARMYRSFGGEDGKRGLPSKKIELEGWLEFFLSVEEDPAVTNGIEDWCRLIKLASLSTFYERQSFREDAVEK
ncbi:hypothetical protein FPV67DRAFT_1459733 [Lyophyllum atratum]|nr:hypothetical protein FPV67DRAFT_1459733 [Lyophyllum atratum]